MARLLGRNDDNEQLLAAGQASVVVLPKAHLLNVLKAGSGTPLDEASAALALLCEAGQYDAVVQYGNPLLKAASAAVPFSPLGGGKQPPVPHLEHLASDLALSIALAHISMAGGAGEAGGTGGSDISAGGALLAAGGSGGGGGSVSSGSGEFASLEEVHGHLEAALQVLERHSVAAPLQQEVGYCLQGVAAAFAEEALRTTPPVSPSPPSASAQPAPAASGAAAGAAGSPGPAGISGAQQSAASATTNSGSGGAVAGGAGGSGGAAARRAKAIAVLRSVLWRGVPQNQSYGNGIHNHSQQLHQQFDGHAMQSGVATAAAAEAGVAPAVAAANGSSSSGGGGGWVPELPADERTELMAPLRGLLTASEHIALYGPVASGQKPYGAAHLSDEELYDLAIAHLAQGVSTGWPQHVLQALSYFERIAQQQQQQQQHKGAGAAATAAATAVDVSFERSVCEALLGRRTTAAGPANRPSAATPSATSPQPTPGHAGSAGASPSGSPLPSSLSGDEWYDEGDESALLRRLEAQLLMAAGGVAAVTSTPAAAPGVLEGAADGAVSFSVKERGDGAISEYDDEYDSLTSAIRGQAPASAAATPNGAAVSPVDAAHKITGAQQQPPQHLASSVAGRPRTKSDRNGGPDDVARKYGWAQSWLELSVMPCFPETAGAGPVSLARWFADPRVILFNKLLAVRSGEAQMTAALGSAVAHVSDASRQRLWQLWQAAAHAVSSARGHALPQTAAAAVGAPEAAVGAKVGGASVSGAAAPLASGLLAQSRAALQDVAPRAAAAASAVAAAAAAVGSAAASSPRAVAAAAGWMVPFGLPRWGTAEKPAAATAAATGGGGGGGRTAVATKAVPRVSATGVAESVTPASGDEDATARDGGRAGYNQGQGHQQQAQVQSLSPNTNNVVPFPGGAAGAGGGSGPATGTSVLASPPSPVPAAPPVGDRLVDVALAAPPAGGGAAAAADAGAQSDAAAAGALWAPDAEGHLRPRPRMVARVVQHAAAAAARITDRLPSGPVRDWTAIALDPAAADEATSREAVRRVAAVAAQAVCLGALAAYVGNRIVASGALQAAAASGYDAAAAAAAPTVDASRAQVAAAARAVTQWLDSAGVGSAALGQWPPLLGGGPAGAGRQAELLLPVGAEAASAESVSRLAERYGRRAQLDETVATALLRGWAAARAAAPALTDPRDRAELLSGLLGGRALRVARAEADRNARVGRRVQLQRLEVELEQLRQRQPAAASSAVGHVPPEEVVVTATVVTAGTETNRASPLPVSYCTRERLALTFRREATEVAPGAVASVAPVWRLVDVRDAPPSLY